jgi:hypothetical protein
VFKLKWVFQIFLIFSCQLVAEYTLGVWGIGEESICQPFWIWDPSDHCLCMRGLCFFLGKENTKVFLVCPPFPSSVMRLVSGARCRWRLIWPAERQEGCLGWELAIPGGWGLESSWSLSSAVELLRQFCSG